MDTHIGRKYHVHVESYTATVITSDQAVHFFRLCAIQGDFF